MIRRMGIFTLLIWCLATGFATAATITSTTLPNGLQVRIQADENLKLTRVGMFFAAGRANDPDSLGGLAHLAEHFLTESSPAYPDGGLMRQSALCIRLTSTPTPATATCNSIRSACRSFCRGYWPWR